MDFPPTGRAEMLMIHHMSFETLISIERVSWRNCPPRRVQRIGSMITLASVSVMQGFRVPDIPWQQLRRRLRRIGSPGPR